MSVLPCSRERRDGGRRGGDGRRPSRVPRRLFRCRGRDILVLHLARGPAIAGTGELRRVVKPGGTIRLLEYVWPRGTIRRAITKLWEPWIACLWSSIRSKPASNWSRVVSDRRA